jgi:hypothetical protein
MHALVTGDIGLRRLRSERTKLTPCAKPEDAVEGKSEAATSGRCDSDVE